MIFSTSSLTVDFVSGASAGEWQQSETDRIRIGRRVCVVTAAIVSRWTPGGPDRATFVIVQAPPGEPPTFRQAERVWQGRSRCCCALRCQGASYSFIKVVFSPYLPSR